MFALAMFAVAFRSGESSSKQLLLVNLIVICSDPSADVRILGHVRGRSPHPTQSCD
jgi:hypothetical protein